MKTIHLARGLTLPADELATEVAACLGGRGSGKSNTAAVIAEQLLAQNIQVVVMDYVGIWFSLRLLPDGKTSSKFQIPVLGGRHGDIALVASTGKVVAEALAKSRSPAVLDLSGFTKTDRIRFAADFAEAFFHAKKDHPSPVQLLLEESQRFCPQVIRFDNGGMARCLGAFEEIAEVGRNFGIGLNLISQRPQKINKDVLNLADTVFSFRTMGVLERKAIAEWVQEKGAEGRKEVQDELPSLPRGSAIVWSPSRQVYGTYAISKKTTYDAGATPIHARAAVKTKSLDLTALEATMGAAVEEAKASDPRALRARIVELERELKNGATTRSANGANASALTKTKTVERDVVSAKSIQRLERLVDKLGKGEERFKEIGIAAIEIQRDRLAQAQQAVVSELGNMHAVMLKAANGILNGARGDAIRTVQRSAEPNGAKRQGLATSNSANIAPLSKCARALLYVIVQRGVATDSQISLLSGYRKTSSTFANAMSELRIGRMIEGLKTGRTPTQAGRDTIGPTEEIPRGPELLRYWEQRLSTCEAALLRGVYEKGTISREELSETAKYRATSSTFANGISALRRLELVHGPQGCDLTISDSFA